MATEIHTYATERGFGAPFFASVLAATTGYFAARKRYSRVQKELSSLSDRYLADIGLTRGDIPRVAREAAGWE